MIISERQAGVAEKGEGEVRLPPDARKASVRRVTQRCEIGGTDVGQFPTFDVAPHLFDRVEFRRVPGQRFARMARLLWAPSPSQRSTTRRPRKWRLSCRTKAIRATSV